MEHSQSEVLKHLPFRALLAVPLLVALLTIPYASGQAQDGPFAVSFVTPFEQQTFYAGPSSFAYSIDVSGVVTGIHGDPTSSVSVQLDIYQGSRLDQTIQTHPLSDGSFTLHFTINPQGSPLLVSVDMLTRHCTSMGADDYCHYYAPYSLPPGQLVLRATASIAGGLRTTAVRHITVDRSAYMLVPVRVVLADDPDQPVANMPVIGTTWLYMWRQRSSTGITGLDGRAMVSKVEALAQAPTRYVFRVEPSVVDGWLYESMESVSVELPPAATSAPEITLKVRKQLGQITGRVIGAPDAAGTVRAVRLPGGASFEAPITANGAFSFANLPVASYLIIAQAEGYSALPQTVDLAGAPLSSISIPVLARNSRTQLTGTLRDPRGTPLPFGWVTTSGVAHPAVPGLGTYAMDDLPQSFTAIASAPGFYSQAQVIGASSHHSADFVLTRRPETRSIPWASGEVLIPPETRAWTGTDEVAMDYGWLWGNGDGAPIAIHLLDIDESPAIDISVEPGSFALEYLPERAMWFYLVRGTATVCSTRSSAQAVAHSGEMVRLADPTQLSAVPLDPEGLALLRPPDRSPLEDTWEPAPSAQARDYLAQMGISVAQSFTFAAFALAALAIFVIPIAVIWGHIKRWGA